MANCYSCMHNKVCAIDKKRFYSVVNRFCINFEHQPTTEEQILNIIESNIDDAKGSFPWTHDDDVKLETLEDLYREIKLRIKEEEKR